ncbi:hypothetical protein GCM10023333_42030 [Ferrimonas pelagia]|uniref:Uncharacterized protein n=1 Tax=Ferrimonas pelagia TaxID=1177826 RepID=A0ABP9FL49_9GAMM
MPQKAELSEFGFLLLVMALSQRDKAAGPNDAVRWPIGSEVAKGGICWLQQFGEGLLTL